MTRRERLFCQALTRQIRQYSDIPLILFSYLNPILAALQSDFLVDAKNAGIDGLLLVDCPLEESQFIRHECMKNDIALIYVITPSTPLARIQKMNDYAQGFLYYACRKGTTGIRKALPDDFQQKIQAIQSAVHLPVVVGFGISNREMSDCVLEHADGVVIGSLFVKALEEGMHPSDLSALAKDIYPRTRCTD
ncbi:MAG: tryptophan synthase subunit alpha [Ginsengibacter sp.]